MGFWITKVLRELDADGIHQRSGRPFDKIVLHKILKNRTYRGLTVHKTEAFPGKHEPIIDEHLWNEAQSISREPPRTRATRSRRAGGRAAARADLRTGRPGDDTAACPQGGPLLPLLRLDGHD